MAVYSKWNRGGVALLSRKPAISLKQGKVGPRLLLMTNRKLHMHFRLVPKSTTLDDLEGPLCTLFQNMCLSEPNTKIWMKIDPYYHSPVTLDSGSVRTMLIFAGVSWRGASNNSGVIENVHFWTFGCCLWHLRKWGQHYYMVLFNFIPVAFHWPQNTWLWMAWMAILH